MINIEQDLNEKKRVKGSSGMSWENEMVNMVKNIKRKISKSSPESLPEYQAKKREMLEERRRYVQSKKLEKMGKGDSVTKSSATSSTTTTTATEMTMVPMAMDEVHGNRRSGGSNDNAKNLSSYSSDFCGSTGCSSSSSCANPNNLNQYATKCYYYYFAPVLEELEHKQEDLSAKRV